MTASCRLQQREESLVWLTRTSNSFNAIKGDSLRAQLRGLVVHCVTKEREFPQRINVFHTLANWLGIVPALAPPKPTRSSTQRKKAKKAQFHLRHRFTLFLLTFPCFTAANPQTAADAFFQARVASDALPRVPCVVEELSESSSSATSPTTGAHISSGDSADVEMTDALLTELTGQGLSSSMEIANTFETFLNDDFGANPTVQTPASRNEPDSQFQQVSTSRLMVTESASFAAAVCI